MDAARLEYFGWRTFEGSVVSQLLLHGSCQYNSRGSYIQNLFEFVICRMYKSSRESPTLSQVKKGTARTLS